MSFKTAGLLLLAVGGVAAALVWQNNRNTLSLQNDAGSEPEVLTEKIDVAEPVIQDTEPVAQGELVVDTTASQSIETDATDQDLARQEQRDQFYQRFEMSLIGNETLSDEDFHALVEFLKNDSELFAQFLLQYRETTDPDKARRLAQVLDEFDDATITAVAEDMVFSGDVGSQVAGLDLLSGQQAENSQAREVVTQVLELETNPEVISAALNALAKPGDVNPEERDRLLNQFVMHSSNNDAAVRRRSLTLMKRWGGEVNMNEHFIAGLQDPNENVRIGALLSLASTKHRSDESMQALVGVVEDFNVDMQSRKTAMHALQKYDLPDYEKQRLTDILAGN